MALGLVDLWTESEDNKNAVYLRIANVSLSPFYNSVTRSNNIALIKLEQSVTFNSAIRPVCLPSLSQAIVKLTPGKRCYATGWGDAEEYSELIKTY